MRWVFLIISCTAVFLAYPSFSQSGNFTKVPFSQLPGWENDDHEAALAAFNKSCSVSRETSYQSKEHWKALCRFAKTDPKGRVFFELMFQPILVASESRTLFTGYYEPTINGSRKRGGKYQTPIYNRPPELKRGVKYKSRREIQNGALSGRGLEIAWIADPVEAFFLQIQGSGRIQLPNGESLRVGFAAKNGHKYRSVGKEMIRLGLLEKSKASAGNIRAWVRKNPSRGREVLAHNGSYIFFREIKDLDKDDGPYGAMQVPVSRMRTIAVDPKFNPLGLPVYIDMQGKRPLQQLMIAQDVGSAIKGAQRADVFFGSGSKAGKIAGTIKASGRMYLLIPKEAYQKVAQANN